MCRFIAPLKTPLKGRLVYEYAMHFVSLLG
jgi:hypothetical protein